MSNAGYVGQSLMRASQYSSARPVARAVEACSIGASTVGRRSAADVLAGMLDLRASVRLSELVSASDRPPVEPTFKEPLLLGDYVRKRLAAIDDAACRRLERPFDGLRLRVMDPAQLAASWTSSGGRTPSDARAFALDTWSSYREYLLGSVARARADVAALREEVTGDLKDAGPRGAGLEALDAVLRAALNDAVPALCERLAMAMETPFVEALTAALAGLPPVVEPAAMAPWFAVRGVLGAQLERTREVTRALLAHEARSVMTLVDAACGAGAP